MVITYVSILQSWKFQIQISGLSGMEKQCLTISLKYHKNDNKITHSLRF